MHGLAITTASCCYQLACERAADASPGRIASIRYCDMPAHTPGGTGKRSCDGWVMKAVRFHEYGGIDVLRVEDAERPVPLPGQVLVQVKAAGIQPGEVHIRTGALHERWPGSFPSGQGSDLAGVIVEAGPQLRGLAGGDEGLGFPPRRASHAEFVIVNDTDLFMRPDGLSWDVAGSLYVAGTTAYATVVAVDPGPGDTVVVSGAAGGVGSLAAQLARLRGATVIGLASEPN